MARIRRQSSLRHVASQFDSAPDTVLDDVIKAIDSLD